MAMVTIAGVPGTSEARTGTPYQVCIDAAVSEPQVEPKASAKKTTSPMGSAVSEKTVPAPTSKSRFAVRLAPTTTMRTQTASAGALVSITEASVSSSSRSAPPHAHSSATASALLRERANLVVAAVGDIEDSGGIDGDEGRRVESRGGSTAVEAAADARAARDAHHCGKGKVDASNRLSGSIADEEVRAAQPPAGQLLVPRRAADVVVDRACARASRQRAGAPVGLRDLAHRAVAAVGEIEELRVGGETFRRAEQRDAGGAIRRARHAALPREDGGGGSR